VKQLDGRGAAPPRRPERRHGLARGGSATEPRKRPSVSLLNATRRGIVSRKFDGNGFRVAYV